MYYWADLLMSDCRTSSHTSESAYPQCVLERSLSTYGLSIAIRVFPQYTKLTMLAFLCWLYLKISKIEVSVTSVWIQNTMANVDLKFIQFWTIYNLFPLVVIEKCQCCQICVSRENSNRTQHIEWRRKKRLTGKPFTLSVFLTSTVAQGLTSVHFNDSIKNQSLQ